MNLDTYLSEFDSVERFCKNQHFYDIGDRIEWETI